MGHDDVFHYLCLGCSYAKILESNNYVGGSPQGSGYPASNVLMDSCEDMSFSHAINNPPNRVAWWVAPDGATDTEAEFTLELGCEKTVDRIMLKNMANGIGQDRSLRVHIDVDCLYCA